MRALFTLSLILSFAISIPAQEIDPLFEKFLEKESVKHASVGFALMDTSGKLLYGQNEELSLAPASTQKLLTSATALELLGHDHRFTTTLSIQGTVTDSILVGNLVIISGGDPVFGSINFSNHYQNYFSDWVKALKAEGINSIDGTILIGDSYFSGDRHAGSTALNDVGNYYGAGAPGFSFMDNEFTVHFKTIEKGKLSEVTKIEPALPEHINIINHVKSGDVSGDNVIIYSLNDATEVFLEGELPPNRGEFTVRGAVPNVSILAAEYFTKKLTESGFRISGEERSGPLYKNSKEICRTKSPELVQILKVLNRKSVNTYADVLLKHIGKNYSNDPSLKGGADAIKNFWNSRGVDPSGIYLEDGSGLSRKNNVTAKFMTEVLQKVGGNPYWEEVMLESSKSGSVKYMWGGEPSGSILAKSGYIGRVRAYSGYLIKDGLKYPFFFTINNYHGSSSAIRKQMGTVLKAVRSEL